MSILLDHVNYIYGENTPDEKQALIDVSVEIKENEMIALVGHTGSGKSTFVQLLNGLEAPSSGTVYYQGTDISEPSFSKRELRGKVGLVFQYPEYQLFEETVIRDVQFGPKNMGFRDLDIELYSFEALKKVGIGDELLDASPLSLSGGQKRRVAIAGVLAMQPEFLILDEPAAGLDPAGKREIMELLKSLHEEKKITILFVSHSMEDVAEYAKRVLVMNEGRIVLDGRSEQIFSYQKELEQIGLGVPQSVSLVNSLKKHGWDIKGMPIKYGETVEAIYEAVTRRSGGSI